MCQGAGSPAWRAWAVEALRGPEAATAPPLPPQTAAFVDAGLQTLAPVLARRGRPPAALADDPQAWLWWVCDALPVGDAKKFAWLSAPSWGARVSAVAQTLRGFGPPLDFVEQTVAYVLTQGAGACGVQ